MSSWAELLEQAGPKDHLVQLYGEDDQLLANRVGRYLSVGLKRGAGLLVIATPEHTQSIMRWLGDEGNHPDLAVRDGRLVVLDAEATLGRFMVNGEPDRALFAEVIGAALQPVRSRDPRATPRAFGEMVGLLWSRGETAAAVALEGYWNRLLDERGISLFCAYPIDVFTGGVEEGALRDLVRAHTHVFASPRTMFSGPAGNARP